MDAYTRGPAACALLSTFANWAQGSAYRPHSMRFRWIVANGGSSVLILYLANKQLDWQMHTCAWERTQRILVRHTCLRARRALETISAGQSRMLSSTQTASL